jgi:hypothetical protein
MRGKEYRSEPDGLHHVQDRRQESASVPSSIFASTSPFFTSMISAICGDIRSALKASSLSAKRRSTQFSLVGLVHHRLKIAVGRSLHGEDGPPPLESALDELHMIANAVGRVISRGHERIRDVLGDVDALEKAVDRLEIYERFPSNTTLKLIREKIGRFPVIYGANRLRESLGSVVDPLLKNCPLWYARYREVPIGIPPTFKDFTLHQFTDGQFGPEPHETGGRPCDRNRFKGTEAQLKNQWPFGT